MEQNNLFIKNILNLMKRTDKILDSITKPYMKKIKQFHWKKRLGNFRISIFKLGKKFCIRLELSSKEWS